MDHILDKDRLARETITGEIDSNLFVEAGAGSGKTSMLVERMVSMVSSGRDISRICAITFTKAAANEFYERFRKRLAQESEDGNAPAREALENIDLCFMGTIDAFCNMIISEHPVEAGVPIDSRVLSDGELMEEYKSWYVRSIKGELGGELKTAAEKLEMYFRDPSDVFAHTMRSVIDTRNAELNYELPDESDADMAFGDRKKELLDFLRFLDRNRDKKYDSSGARPDRKVVIWSRLGSLTERYSRVWETGLRYVIGDLKRDLENIRILPELYSEIEKNFSPELSSWFEPSKSGKFYSIGHIELLDELESHRFAHLIDMVETSKDALADELRKQGKLSYFDYLFYLRDLMKRDAAEEGKLIDHIYNRHSYFLIDEFQDTDPIQAEIFFYLTSYVPKDDWRECKPKPGSLFIVGDPKQSIYRFRNADVRSYNRVKKLFGKDVGKVVKLTRNFRSTNRLCGWFNDTFEKMLSEETEMQSRFDPIPLVGDDGEDNWTGIYSYKVNKANSSPEKVASIIEKIVDDPGRTIRERDKEGKLKPPRRIDYGDIMIITKSKARIESNIKELRSRGIPYRVEGDTLFGECEVLKVISLILNAAAADPKDNKAAFAVLKHTDCDLKMRDIDEYRSRLNAMSPAAGVAFLLDDTWRKYVDEEYIEYAYYALELLRAREADGTVSSLKEAARFISMLVAGDGEEERCLQFDKDENVVHIANLHKVKGLEKPVVILAAQGTTRNSVRSSVQYGSDVPQSWIYRVEKNFSAIGRSPRYEELYKQAYDEEMACLDAETTRQLYVAATRASHVLIIGSCDAAVDAWGELYDMAGDDVIETSGIGRADRMAVAGLMEMIGESDDEEIVTSEELYEEAKSSIGERGTGEREEQEAPSFELKHPSTLEKSESGYDMDSDGADEDPGIGERTGKRRADLIGTMVHRLMEILVSSRMAADPEKAIRGILLEYGGEVGGDEDYFSKILNEVAEDMTVNGGYPQEDTSSPQDILSVLMNADEVYCELPFCYRSQDESAVPTIWHGVMDVVYREQDNWHILDYKTNTETENIEEQYESQLEAYRDAFREITGETADTKIYSIPV